MESKINILIIEDESIIAESIKLTLESLNYNVVGIVDNALDAVEVINNNKIDLAILDINIQGDKNGIWIAKNMFQNKPFIYLTAYGDEKTISDASKTNPSSYLLKPFRKDNISAAIQLAIINHIENKPAKIDSNITNNFKKDLLKQNKFFFIKQKETYFKLKINEILFIESDKNYIKIQTTKQYFTLRSTLKDIIDKLPKKFIQIHRSFIVNKKKVSSISLLNVKINDFTLPLGKSYKKSLLSQIDTFN